MEVNRFITSELFMSTFPPVLFLFHCCLDTRKKKKYKAPTPAASQSGGFWRRKCDRKASCH